MATDNRFRQLLRAGDLVYGAWSVTSSVEILAAFGGIGLDYVVVDMQHGSATESDLPALMSVISNGGSSPLVRLRGPDSTAVARALDLGAHGIIAPSINSAVEAQAIVDASRYFPAGKRSLGRLLGGVDDPICIIMIETISALDDLDGISRISGLDALYVGPMDLSHQLGGVSDADAEPLKSALRKIIGVSRARRVPVGVHASDGQSALHYKLLGCQMLTVIADVPMLAAEARRQLKLAHETRPSRQVP
jgi:4-hydroxy-2-oxoheptanedioate aldolase